jgi:hypothetical protein
VFRDMHARGLMEGLLAVEGAWSHASGQDASSGSENPVVTAMLGH